MSALAQLSLPHAPSDVAACCCCCLLLERDNKGATATVDGSAVLAVWAAVADKAAGQPWAVVVDKAIKRWRGRHPGQVSGPTTRPPLQTRLHSSHGGRCRKSYWRKVCRAVKEVSHVDDTLRQLRLRGLLPQKRLAAVASQGGHVFTAVDKTVCISRCRITKYPLRFFAPRFHLHMPSNNKRTLDDTTDFPPIFYQFFTLFQPQTFR